MRYSRVSNLHLNQALVAYRRFVNVRNYAVRVHTRDLNADLLVGIASILDLFTCKASNSLTVKVLDHLQAHAWGNQVLASTIRTLNNLN